MRTSSCLRVVKSFRFLSCAVNRTLTDSVSTLTTSSSSSIGGVGDATGVAGFCCASTSSPPVIPKPISAATATKTKKQPLVYIVLKLLELLQAVTHRTVASFRAQLILAGLRRIGKSNLDLALTAIVV